jgi:8-oxo-dGTP diphosphatase
MRTIHVVAAVLEHDGRIFATQRGYGEFKGYWEFPGGKIEPGETPQQALRREIQEELATTVAVGPLVGTVEYDYPDFHLSMQCYHCRVLEGHLTLLEHEDARWLPLDALASVDWLPADWDLIHQWQQQGGVAAAEKQDAAESKHSK